MFTARTKKFATALAAILTLSAPLTVMSSASFAAPASHAQIARNDTTHRDARPNVRPDARQSDVYWRSAKAHAAKQRMAERGDHFKHNRDCAHHRHDQRGHFGRDHRHGGDRG